MSVTAELHSVPLFEGCAFDDIDAVAGAVSGRRDLDAGAVVCTEGDKADRWWIVADGTADVTVRGLYTATIGPGETIGELALLDGQPRAATVTAVTDLQLYEVDGNAFLDVLLASPRLAIAFLRELATRLRATNLHPQPPARTAPAVAQSQRVPRSVVTQPRALDPHTPGFYDNPAAHLATLRETAPVHWSEAISSWVVLRYDDVHRLARSRSLVGSVATMEPPPAPNPDGTMRRPRPGHRMMIRKDGDDHVRLRRLVSKVFTPRAIAQWRQRTETIVEQLLDAASARTEIDVMLDLALPLPAQVISEMLGMPHDDTPQLRAWSRALTQTLDPVVTPEQREAADTAGRATTSYLEAVIADKRANPGDDILTALLNAEDDGHVL